MLHSLSVQHPVFVCNMNIYFAFVFFHRGKLRCPPKMGGRWRRSRIVSASNYRARNWCNVDRLDTLCEQGIRTVVIFSLSVWYIYQHSSIVDLRVSLLQILRLCGEWRLILANDYNSCTFSLWHQEYSILKAPKSKFITIK